MEAEYEGEAESEQERSLNIALLAQELAGALITLEEALLQMEKAEVLNDLQEDVRRFQAFADRGHRLPCIVNTSSLALPVDASGLPAHGGRRWENDANSLRLQVQADTGLQTEMVPSKDVSDSFMARIGRALGIRAGGADMVTKDDGIDAGLEVKVTTQTIGGRVFYSPATLFTRLRVFGAPTSPVTRPISPGVYLFGVEIAAGSARWDAAEYEIPPMYDVRLSL